MINEMPLPILDISEYSADRAIDIISQASGLEAPPACETLLYRGEFPDLPSAEWPIWGEAPTNLKSHAASARWHLLSRWHASRLGWRGPADVWADPDIRGSILKDARGSTSIARRLLLGRSYVAKLFSPFACASIYAHFASKLGRPISVLDPCAGWGDRLAAALGSPAVKSYYGVDANKRLHQGYREQIDRYGDDSFEVKHGAFEDQRIEPDQFDLVLTSPPYYTTEIYSLDSEQSIIRYRSFDGWVEGFLRPLLIKASRVTAPGGHVALNIMNTLLKGQMCPLIKATIDATNGLPLSKAGLILLPPNSPGAPRDKSEPILVWRKHGR